MRRSGGREKKRVDPALAPRLGYPTGLSHKKSQYNEGNEPILSFKRRKPMSLNVVYTEADVCNFVEALSQLTDDRDNRGKRHALEFVVAGAVVAIFSGRATGSRILTYLPNRIQWLREVTQHPEAGV